VVFLWGRCVRADACEEQGGAQAEFGDAVAEAVTGALAPVQAGSSLDGRISAGGSHTCGVTSAFRAKCCGNNLLGQLGDGTKFNRSIPVNVRRLREVPKAGGISGGTGHTCALVVDDASNSFPWCWGGNSSGQLGDGTTLDRVKPRHVITLKKEVTAITVGSYHTCALKDDRIAKCWGNNNSGQLGDGTETNQLIPVRVLGFK